MSNQEIASHHNRLQSKLELYRLQILKMKEPEISVSGSLDAKLEIRQNLSYNNNRSTLIVTESSNFRKKKDSVMSQKSQLNNLIQNENSDSVNDIKTKPSVVSEGFERISEVGVSEIGQTYNPIIYETPNLYKQNGASMSKIPYAFQTPVPTYFKENGWFEDENTFKFVNWAFSKCSTQSRKVIYDNIEIILEPFEFIWAETQVQPNVF